MTEKQDGSRGDFSAAGADDQVAFSGLKDSADIIDDYLFAKAFLDIFNFYHLICLMPVFCTPPRRHNRIAASK